MIDIYLCYDLMFNIEKRPSTIGRSALQTFDNILYVVFLITIIIVLFTLTYLMFNFYQSSVIFNGVFVLTFIVALLTVNLLNSAIDDKEHVT